MEENIRTRAYFKWLSRSDHGHTSTLDDWLRAEEEELALELVRTVKAAAPDLCAFSQDALWFGAEQLTKLFNLMSPALRRRRGRSRLLAMIEKYQDYLTSSHALTDDEAIRIGKTIYRIGRLLCSLVILVGNDLTGTRQHSVHKELKDIFSECFSTFETSEFNLHNAATIHRYTGLEVLFIGEGADKSPDLEVRDLAYVECKDVQTGNQNILAKTLEDHLKKATLQLRTARANKALPGSGVCIDVPLGSLPLPQDAWKVLRIFLSDSDGPDFVRISCSGVRATSTHVGGDVRTCLVWRASGEHLFQPLLRHLGQESFKMHPQDFEPISHRSSEQTEKISLGASSRYHNS
jgi:hypothetical protein